MIDFTPVWNEEVKFLDFANQYSVEELRAASNASIDHILSLIDDLDDAAMVFDPVDEAADDPHAIEGEETIGWSIAHLVAHVTASTEEGAAISSMLARGFASSERPRYETPWRDLKTKAQVIQRLEESRRIRLGYLNAWPDTPFLEVYRDVSPRFTEIFGSMNAPAAFLFGLRHEASHYEQIKDVREQALAAK